MIIQPRDPSEAKEAKAPYNFVPLPERAVAVGDPPPHDSYDPERKTGYFDVELTTLSPLYVRCGLSRRLRPRNGDKRSAWQIAQAEKAGEAPNDFHDAMKNLPDFFHTGDAEQPVIPGSSLRGMLRSLLSIVTYSKVTGVTEKKLFYRSVDSPHYQIRMAQKIGVQPSGMDISAPSKAVNINAEAFASKVETGLLKRKGREWVIERCDMARIQQRDLEQPFGRQLMDQKGPNDPNGRPNWNCQHKTVWVDVDPSPQNYFFKAQPVMRQGQVVPGRFRHQNQYLVFRLATNPAAKASPGKKAGTVVLTGNIQYKHLAFVFLHSEPLEEIKVPNSLALEDINERLIDRFHDKDQITQWQQAAFPKGRPSGARRDKDGYLRDNEPVFFLRENGKLVFFGRAQMFRLPYLHRPVDLVPEELREEYLTDYADALFGYVRRPDKTREAKQGDIARSYAGRINVSDATLVSAPEGLWLDYPIVETKILATPKPTCYQHYLTQETDDKRNLMHYDSEGAQIRGHKLYWHQGAIEEAHLWERNERNLVGERVDPKSTQHTRVKPVREGVTFRFRVYFENLTAAELGALAWTLQPQGEQPHYAHKLGMGKSLGMGSVSINNVSLTLTDRKVRYSKLFGEEGWETGSATDDPATYRAAFEAALLNELGLDPETTPLCRVRRIAHLLRMLEWSPKLSEEMQWRVGSQLLDDFRNRYVLAAPLYETAQQGLVDPRPQPRRVPQSGGTSASSKKTLAPETPSAVPTSRPKRTTATVVSYRKAKAYVTLDGVDGFSGEIACANAPTWPAPPKAGDRYSVDVAYDKNGKVTGVKFRSAV